eukprot:CAMPEP_0184371610 /NCGR_PEP_ID=MMETSP1089-20130417/163497_1 /TAXON_ID=38269 ORGANISM="Gloeochaete wittrockiana, Strain SAG46.84" /NCGR_SAMPLE_ID=MMETSP1089 /ASSEMBLY_ACC=CAM_ASM_000445 /LENGTH=72 /DNA_ID=CAMNT_0026714389 /DNA_START=2157 /DNA_END=2375 /DNA_ORIENTATION=+
MAPSGTVTASKMVDLDVVTLGLVVSFVVSNGDIPNWSGAGVCWDGVAVLKLDQEDVGLRGQSGISDPEPVGV